MSATLTEALVERRNRAAIRAYRAAEALGDASAGDLGAQADLEIALADFRNYARLFDELRPVLDELGVYRREGGHSVLGDLRTMKVDGAAAERIRSHNRSQWRGNGLLEARDVGVGNIASIPAWAVSDAAPRAIAAAPLLNLIAKRLPPRSGLELRLVSMSTVPVAAIQSALNAAVQESDPVDGYSTHAVKTSALRIDVALQLLEQGRAAIDATLLPAMVEAVDAAAEAYLYSELNALTGRSTRTYTDLTPTPAEFWPEVEALIRAVQSARRVGGRPLVVMHPRRASWLRADAGNTANRFGFGPPVTPGTDFSVMGAVDVITAPAIPTNSGIGTNEDLVYVFPGTVPDVLDVWAGDRTVEVLEAGSAALSSSLTASIYARRYVAAASRLPAGVGVLSGTGLVAP